MKIRKMYIQNQKKFRNGVQLDFFDPIKRKTRDRTVIVGKNGSGKTSLLQTIYSIMKLLEYGKEGIREVDHDLFSPSRSSMLIEQPSESTMIEVHTGRNANRFEKPNPSICIDRYKSPGFLLESSENRFLDEFIVQHDVAKEFLQDIRNAIAGVDEDPVIGNLIYFPTDRLTHFSTYEQQVQMVNERPEFKWAYKYNRFHDKWEGSLESYLCWLHYRDLKRHEARFDEFKGMVNQFLEDKQITDVGLDYRVIVKDQSGATFGLEALSSGEKQIVLLIGEIYRYIQAGSIVLIDEPELHLHPVWQRKLVDTLTRLCKKYDAQLIMTTQSPKIAEIVNRREIVELDDLLEESGL